MEDAGRGICTKAVAGELVGTLPSKSIRPGQMLQSAEILPKICSAPPTLGLPPPNFRVPPKYLSRWNWVYMEKI